MPPIPSLCPQVPYNKSLAKLLFFSETLYNPFPLELVKTCHFKIKPSESLGAKVYFIIIIILFYFYLFFIFFCLPWAKTELKAMVKNFPKATKVPPDLQSNIVFRLINFVSLTYITFVCLLLKARPSIG